jgi:hypothetical protein
MRIASFKHLGSKRGEPRTVRGKKADGWENRHSGLSVMQPRSGDWVVVRSKEEILATLDKNGRLEGLPFMPEMFEYCGRRVRISSSAHKTCGPIQGRYFALQTKDLVHLGYRCNGKAHDGCQNGCQIFWHTAWLRHADADAAAPTANGQSGCTQADVVAATRVPDLDGAKRYSCQATALTSYAHPLRWWDARTYWMSYQTRNHTLRELLNGICFMIYCKVAGPYGDRFGMRRFYDAFQAWRGGSPFPRRFGLVPAGQKTPVVNLGLKPRDYADRCSATAWSPYSASAVAARRSSTSFSTAAARTAAWRSPARTARA